MGRPPRHPRDPGRQDPHARRARSALSLTDRPATRLPEGTVPSPNIWEHPDVYEAENRAFDPEGLVEATMRRVAGVVDWTGLDVLDVGCGTGFHLPRFAATARSATGVEPHPDLLALARRRTRRVATIEVRGGTAQALPVPDATVDVTHARWAYFFGPGCEPGLGELDRVLRPGGTAFVIDNDPVRSTFGRWFRRGYPHLPAPSEIERFWARHGWTREPVLTRWSFGSCAELEAVLRIEFAPKLAQELVAEHNAAGGGTEVDYAVNVWWRRP